MTQFLAPILGLNAPLATHSTHGWDGAFVFYLLQPNETPECKVNHQIHARWARKRVWSKKRHKDARATLIEATVIVRKVQTGQDY